MKCKRIFKVVSALALTVALMVSTGVVSFAAIYTTTTKYLDQNTIEVTSVAIGLETGDMATYVAYNNDEFSEANAVYIDQATAVTNEAVKFTYQTSSDNVKATVKFGGSTEETAVDPDIDGLTVKIVVDGTDCGVAEDLAKVSEDPAYVGEYLAREFEVSITDGNAIDTVTFTEDGAATGTPVETWYVKNGAIVVLSNVIKSNGTLNIATKEVTPSVVLGTVNTGDKTITAFAKAVCAANSEYNYGIVIAKDTAVIGEGNHQNWDTEGANYETQVRFNALGKGNDGGFAVEVTDEDYFVTGNKFNVKAYVDVADTVVYSTKTEAVEF